MVHLRQVSRPLVCSLWLILAFLSGCDSSSPDPGEEDLTFRGDVIRVEQIQKYTAREIRQIAENFGVPYVARFDVTIHRIEYTTANADGKLMMASGAIAVPEPVTRQLPMVSFQDGTTVHRLSVPSRGGMEEILAGLLFSADGYLSVMTDLIGLGSSEGLHPYLVADVSASAVIDMLRAVVHWSATHSWDISREVYLAGYSSGGYTAMATHRALEADYADEFTVAASAPMAGPYDLSGTMLELMLRKEPYPQPYFLPYLLLSYNEVYDLYESPSDFLASPYDTTLPPLFDGTHRSAEINAAMPQIPIQIVRQDMLRELEDNPGHPLIRRLRENDLLNWAPRSPMRLYHCDADELVPVKNSQVADRELGPLATLVDPSPNSGHVACAFIAIAGARAWFNSIATASR